MKQGSVVDFYYFSGTGNTLLVAEEIARVLKSDGYSVSLHRMELFIDKRPPLEKNAALGLAFPVAVQSTYPFVWKFVESLPEGDGREVFMVDTLATFSGGIVGPLKKALEKKGYTPIGAIEIKMPSNYRDNLDGAEAEKVVK